MHKIANEYRVFASNIMKQIYWICYTLIVTISFAISDDESWQGAFRRKVKVAVFIDDQMIKTAKTMKILETTKGKTIKKKLELMIQTMLQQVELAYHYRALRVRLRFTLAFIKAFNFSAMLNLGWTQKPSINSYLRNFCTWQCQRYHPKKTYDYAFLLTGSDLDSEKKEKLQGLAFLGGSCSCQSSCFIAETLSFISAFTAIHELGHAFGVQHDGTGNACNETSHMMSPSAGVGKSTWSKCSDRQMDAWIRKHDCMPKQPNMTYDDLKSVLQLARLPGQRYNATIQCQIHYGTQGHLYTSLDISRHEKDAIFPYCHGLVCLNTETKARGYVHLPLDGTECSTANDKVCFEGRCVPKDWFETPEKLYAPGFPEKETPNKT